MSESIYKIVELVGSSPVSWEDAAKNAVETASKTLRDLRIAEATTLDMKIENGKVQHPRIVDGLAIALQVNPAWLQWGEPYAAMSVKQTFRAPF